MTPTQFREALGKLRLTQVGFAHLMGQGDRTARGWILGERTIPRCIELWLKAMLDGTVAIADIERLKALDIKALLKR